MTLKRVPTKGENGFVDNAFLLKLQRFRSSSNEVNWADIARADEIGGLVHALDAENVAIRFNRTKDRGTLVVTIMANGEYYNLYAQDRGEWEQILQDLVSP